MSGAALAQLQRARVDLAYFGETFAKVRTKTGALVAFTLNDAQRELHRILEEQKRKYGWVRAIILKGRQMGCTTYIGVRYYRHTSMHRGVNTFILSHEQQASDTIFGMVDRIHRNNPLAPHVGVSNVKELEFDRLDSSYAVATAGNKATGRSKAVSLFHGCLSPSSIIVEPSGNGRRMGDFRVGDLVRTHTGAVAPVSFISYKVAGTLRFKVQGVNAPMVATPEHQFWTPVGKRELRGLRAGDVIGYPVASLGDTAPRWRYRREADWRAQGGGTQAVGPAWVEGTYDVGRVLGLFLAEGSVFRQVGGQPAGVSFSVHAREVERTLTWLAPLRDGWRSEPKVTARKGSLTRVVTVYSRSFAEFVLARCGELDDKTLPVDWCESADFAQGLLHGYLAGDGHSAKREYNRRISAPSVRSAITFGMRDVAAALGYGWAGVSYREGAVRNGRAERAQWTFRLEGGGVDLLCTELGWSMPPRRREGRSKVEIRDGFAWVPVQWVEDAGMQEVMDFEVDHPDHSYLTWQGASSNSEVAFWANASDHFAASVQAVPLLPGTEILLESTSAGATGDFYERYVQAERGEGDYLPVFLPWWLDSGYQREPEPGFLLRYEAEPGFMCEVEYADTFKLSLSRMAWRRAKIVELRSQLLFQREYPADPSEAWTAAADHEPYIGILLCMRARKRRTQGAGPLVIGVDPASGGGDRFAVAARRGACVEWVRHRNKIDHIEAAAWIRSIIDAERPARVNIDAGNIGAAVIAQLKAMGPEIADLVRGVNFGGTSQAKLAKPKVPGPQNRRAEMYQRLLQWLESGDEPSLPDLPELQTDLTAPRLKPLPNNDFLLESKVDMKRRGVRSTDLSDAVALTFASNEYFKTWSEPTVTAAAGDIDRVVHKYTTQQMPGFTGMNGWMC